MCGLPQPTHSRSRLKSIANRNKQLWKQVKRPSDSRLLPPRLQFLGFGAPTELPEQFGITANASGRVWVFGDELFSDGERAAVQRLSLGVAALAAVELRQIVEA